MMKDHPLTRKMRWILPVAMLIGMLVMSLVGSGVAQATDTDHVKTTNAQLCGSAAEITNTTTTEQFCDLQAAIDDTDTVNGHTLSITAGTLSGSGNFNVNVNKELTISGAGAGADDSIHTIIDLGGNVGLNILANNVTITGLTVQNGDDAVRFNSNGSTFDSTLLESVWLINNASHGVRIMNNTTANNLDITNGSQVTGNVVGLGVDSTSSFDGIGISDSTFANDDYGVNIVNSGASSTIRNLVVSGNSQFNGHSLAAIHAEELHDSTVENSVFTDNRRGVDIFKNAGTGGIVNVVVQNNTFTGSTEASIMLFVNAIGLGSFSAIGNTINQDVGLWLDPWGAIDIQLVATVSHGTVLLDSNNITLSGTFDLGATAAYGIRVGGGSDDIDITGNTLLGGSVGGTGSATEAPTSGVLLLTDHPTFQSMSASAEFSVTSNDISDFIVGVNIYNADSNTNGGVPGSADVSINQNNLTGNGPDAAGHGVRNGVTAEDALVNAACNWWGDALGPGIVGPGGGDRVTGNVVYQPWLIAPAPSGSCTGGDTGNLEVVKTVNWGNSESQDIVFEICVSGPAPQNPVDVCQNIGGPEFETGSLLFTNLPAGEYTVRETDPVAEPPGARWEVIISVEGTISVEPGSTAEASVVNNYFPPDSGNMDVTKVVDWNGVTPNEAQTFEICITGPAPSTAQQCLTYDFDGETQTFQNLLAGDYTVSETDPGSNWSTVISTNPVTVVIGQTATSTVTNTHLLGSAEINKVVNWGETTPDEGQTFEICITGPSPSTNQQCGEADFDGGTVSFSDLLPGDYTVSETNPGTNWTTQISVNPITVVAGGNPAASTVTNTYNPPVEPGSLTVTKVVNWGETTPNEAQTFEICITGPSPSTNQQCGEAGFDGGDVPFSNLQPGEYTISETDPGANWTVVISTNPVSVASNQNATSTVTNTYNVEPNPGSLVITKVVDWGTSEPDNAQTFEICITGPENRCDTVGYEGGEITFAGLIAGEYTISETDPGPNWLTTIVPNPVSVADGQTATATVTNVYEESEFPPECQGIRIDNVIYGTEGTDRGAQAIHGTEGNDLIFGLGGHDDIFGHGGDDCIFGGDGHDYIEGNDGNDLIFGGNDMDNIVGGNGNDYAEGNGDDDFIEGNAGEDRLFGNDGSDCIFGGDGNDYIEGNAGSDAPLVGNGDDDIMYGGDGHDQLYGDGYDGVHPTGSINDEGNPGNDQLFGEAGSDYFDGGPGNDLIDGGPDSDNMFGGDNDDTLTGGGASDAFFGNGGFDTATDYDGSDDWICQSVEVGCDGPPPADSDGDGVPDTEDVCPGFDDNVDVDGDGTPDGCDALIDSDGDSVADADDLCPGYDDNLDADSDGTPDDCDDDDDNDGVPDVSDLCPGGDDTVDVDGDGVPDACDSLIDSDDDGVADTEDVCPGYDDNVDTDSDGTPDGCDDTPNGDDDNDGVDNSVDVCPGFDDNVDTDGDGTPDGCDPTPNGEVTVNIRNQTSCEATVTFAGNTYVLAVGEETGSILVVPGPYTIEVDSSCNPFTDNVTINNNTTLTLVDLLASESAADGAGLTSEPAP